MIYRTLLADPPWHTRTGPLQGRAGFGDAVGASRPLPYATMSVAEIAALPVASLAHPDGCHLYLCTINRYVDAAYTVARAWGFEPSTLLVWCKSTMGAGLGGAFGISTEFILFARRGTLKPLRREPRTWFNWKRPYDKRGKPRHSAKPPELRALIASMSPGPWAELFARELQPGWDVWGDEVASNQTISGYLQRLENDRDPDRTARAASTEAA